MKAVGDAAFDMMDFIVADYEKGEQEKKAGGVYQPDYDGCIKISTEASLKKMVAPGALVLGSPLAAGFLFGPKAVAGLLAGAIVSGVQIAISASNTGGAWDNAKKEVEKRRSAFRSEAKAKHIDLDLMNRIVAEYQHQHRDEEHLPEPTDQKVIDAYDWHSRQTTSREKHIAAVVGDTVGDPLKDTSGPAINILIKLSAITSLVFGNYIKAYNLAGVFKAKADASA
jgi:inorganic pyrophosphatase